MGVDATNSVLERNMISDIDPQDVAAAQARIAPYTVRTPIRTSTMLNERLGANIFFKCEMFQKMGAYKARGALNALLAMKERGEKPSEIVAFSSGNHGQSAAWASKMMGLPCTVFIPKGSSEVKIQAARSFGAKVVVAESRAEAERLAAEASAKEGAFMLPPYDHDDVIRGQGTACLEGLQDMPVKPDAVFVPCGGGGLMSGTWLATRLVCPDAKVFAGEPLKANDAARSYRDGKIFRFDATPETVADGARTLGLAPRTFNYIRRTNGFFEIEEQTILYWAQWMNHLLKVTCEPSSALAMAAAHQWLKAEKPAGKPNILVILTGGNMSAETYRAIWQQNFLEQLPSLE